MNQVRVLFLKDTTNESGKSFISQGHNKWIRLEFNFSMTHLMNQVRLLLLKDTTNESG